MYFSLCSNFKESSQIVCASVFISSNSYCGEKEMSSSSDGREGPTHEKEILIVDQEMESRSGKRKFDHLDILESLESLTEEQIKEIIGIVKKHNANQSPQKTPEPEDQTDKFTLVSYKSKKTNQQSHNYTGQQNSGPLNNKQRNVSVRMKEILNKSYNNLFYINTLPQINTRTEMADIWESERPGNADIILKTKKGFLLKTDTPKIIINNTLKSLKSSGKITNYSSTNPYNQNTRSVNIPIQSYSCVISSVETDISDIQIAEHLKNLNFNFRYCKRIISKKSNLPTHFIRIITGDIESNEKLLKEGLFYKSRHYAVFPSAPPPPAPLPCGKCLEYTHKVEDCTAPVKCQKCNDKHPTAKCPTHLPPKCTSCGSEQHQAWSFQCPNRPTKSIEGIPNLPIKTLNKKSRELSCETKKKSRIHSAVTIHDMIINTFVEELNKPKNSNREELLLKLKKKFIREYNVETSISFVGNNWIYILMFDLEMNDYNSPTEIIPGSNSSQIRIQT